MSHAVGPGEQASSAINADQVVRAFAVRIGSALFADDDGFMAIEIDGGLVVIADTDVMLASRHALLEALMTQGKLVAARASRIPAPWRRRYLGRLPGLSIHFGTFPAAQLEQESKQWEVMPVRKLEDL